MSQLKRKPISADTGRRHRLTAAAFVAASALLPPSFLLQEDYGFNDEFEGSGGESFLEDSFLQNGSQKRSKGIKASKKGVKDASYSEDPALSAASQYPASGGSFDNVAMMLRPTDANVDSLKKNPSKVFKAKAIGGNTPLHIMAMQPIENHEAINAKQMLGVLLHTPSTLRERFRVGDSLPKMRCAKLNDVGTDPLDAGVNLSDAPMTNGRLGVLQAIAHYTKDPKNLLLNAERQNKVLYKS